MIAVSKENEEVVTQSNERDKRERRLRLSLFSLNIIDMKNISEIIWQDAAYSYNASIPNNFPSTERTIGVIVEETDEYINIATNFEKINEKERPTDGFVIPKGAIISIKRK